MNDINQAYVEKIRDAAHQGELYRVQTAQQATILGAGAAPTSTLSTQVAELERTVAVLHTECDARRRYTNELEVIRESLRAENRKLIEEVRNLRAMLARRFEEPRDKEDDRAWAWGQVWDKCMSIDSNMAHGDKTGVRCVLNFIDSLAAKAVKFDSLKLFLSNSK